MTITSASVGARAGRCPRADGIERCDLVVDWDLFEPFHNTLDPAGDGWGKGRDGAPGTADATGC